jgi:hypothetical protein
MLAPEMKLYTLLSPEDFRAKETSPMELEVGAVDVRERVVHVRRVAVKAVAAPAMLRSPLSPA